MENMTYNGDYAAMFNEVDKKEKNRLKLSLLGGLLVGIALGAYMWFSVMGELAGENIGADATTVVYGASLFMFLVGTYTGTAAIYGSGRIERMMKQKKILGSWSLSGTTILGWVMVILAYTLVACILYAIGGLIYLYKLPGCIKHMIARKPIIDTGMSYDELIEYANQNRMFTLIALVVLVGLLVRYTSLWNIIMENQYFIAIPVAIIVTLLRKAFIKRIRS